MMVGEARFRHETERLSDSAAHCFHCTSLDHSVGQILDALEASGFADRITVVDSSDHGENLGARGLWKKSNFYPERVDIPLINVDSELGTWSAIPRSACWTCRRRFRISLARSCLAGHVAAGYRIGTGRPGPNRFCRVPCCRSCFRSVHGPSLKVEIPPFCWICAETFRS